MQPRARMLCKLGAMRGAEFDVGAAATIGRAAENDVVLTPKEVSSSHARIFWDDEAESYFLEDLGSLNGTTLDGVPVSGRERLGRLHVITFGGGLDLIYQGPELVAGRPHEAPPPAAAEAPPEIPAPPGEGTMVDEELVILPAALTAPAEPESAPEPAGEGTMIDEELVILPEALTAPPEPAPVAEPEPAPELEPAGEGTMIDEELVILPAALTAPSPAEATPSVDPPPPVDAAPPDAGSEGTVAEETPPPELAAALAAAEPAAGFALRVLGFGPPRSHPLHPGENRIGRAADAEVRIASPEVSRVHAVLSLRAGRLYLADAGSRNRTYVDDEPIAGEVEVTPASELRFGTVEAEVVAPGGAGEEESA